MDSFEPNEESDSEAKNDKPNSDDELAETSVKTNDASTQTTNSYFLLQVYEVDGEMKLAFNTTSAFSEQ